jgi:hypothetical protein
MKHLGSLTGTGTVDVKGVAVGDIEYSIDVWLDERNQSKSARGSAQGDMNALTKAFNAGGGSLNLESGGALDIIVIKLGVNGADLTVSGAVPGF